jgi:hypothetical protein
VHLGFVGAEVSLRVGSEEDLPFGGLSCVKLRVPLAVSSLLTLYQEKIDSFERQMNQNSNCRHGWRPSRQRSATRSGAYRKRAEARHPDPECQRIQGGYLDRGDVACKGPAQS